MKWITLLILTLPIWGFTQTVHIEKDRIVYKQTVLIDASKEELYAKAKSALRKYVRGGRTGMITDDPQQGEIVTKGFFRLSSAYNPLKKLQYIIRIKADDGNYKYHIDSVYLIQQERGEEPQYIPSENLFSHMDISGPVAIATEKQLNEIDMKFQRLIDLIGLAMRRASRK